MSDDVTITPTVLVVEDEPLIRLDTIYWFEEAGFITIEAGNAADALALLRARTEIGLLFTDIDMPGDMNGLQLAHVVCKEWPDLRIMLTSGRMAPSSGDLPLGATFIPKPVDFNALTWAVRPKQ